MPPEPNGHNSDLDTRYQKYFSSIGTTASPRPAPPERQGGRRRWLAVVGVAAATLLGLFAGMAWQGSQAPAQTKVITRTVPAASDCQKAVDQADRSLNQAVRIERAMAEHTEYMNLLMQGKIDSATAMKRGLPSLIAGASASVSFDHALSDYRRVVKTCQLPTGSP
ncbi:MAG TPA: hypothetical protein VF486_00725 [Actinomycetes bacterium]